MSQLYPAASRLDRRYLELEIGRSERDREVAEERPVAEQSPAIGPRITEPDLRLPSVLGRRQSCRDEGGIGGGRGHGQGTPLGPPQVDRRRVRQPAGQEGVDRSAVDK